MAVLPEHPAHDDLRRRWRSAVSVALPASGPGPESDTAAGPAGSPQPGPGAVELDRYADDLLGRWAEPQRRYHTTDHLVAVLDRIDELAEYADDPDLVRLAAWFHDAVYLPERSTNEERSARLAERALTELGHAPARTAEVARLVLLTLTHDPDDEDRDGAVLCDADLAVLAGAPDAYAAYAAAVREEYGFVPDDAFREGRAAVLRRLLELPRLFRTPHGVREWEEPARQNLTTELTLLTAQDASTARDRTDDPAAGPADGPSVPARDAADSPAASARDTADSPAASARDTADSPAASARDTADGPVDGSAGATAG